MFLLVLPLPVPALHKFQPLFLTTPPVTRLVHTQTSPSIATITTPLAVRKWAMRGTPCRTKRRRRARESTETLTNVQNSTRRSVKASKQRYVASVSTIGWQADRYDGRHSRALHVVRCALHMVLWILPQHQSINAITLSTRIICTVHRTLHLCRRYPLDGMRYSHVRC